MGQSNSHVESQVAMYLFSWINLEGVIVGSDNNSEMKKFSYNFSAEFS